MMEVNGSGLSQQRPVLGPEISRIWATHEINLIWWMIWNILPALNQIQPKIFRTKTHTCISKPVFQVLPFEREGELKTGGK